MKTVNFKTSAYFHWTFMLAGIVMSIVGVRLIMENSIVAIILLALSFVLITTHYRMEIDFRKKQYHDYVWLSGLRIGERKLFDKLEYIFIKPIKVSQRMNMRVASSVVHKEQFDGYLKLLPGEAVHLMTKDSREEILKHVRTIANKLSLRVVDYSKEDANA